MRRAPLLLSSSLFLLVAACGDWFDSVEDPVDARGPDYTYVVSDVDIPMTDAEATAFALEIDMQPGRDNRFGAVMEAVNALASGIDVEATLDARIDRGDVIVLVNLDTRDLVNASGVGFYVLQGSNPMPPACADANDQVCRRHLSGDATFEAADTDSAIGGRIVNTHFTGGPGSLTVQLGELTLPMQRVKAELVSVSRETLGTSKIVGGIAASDLDSVVIPGLAALVRASAPAVTDAEVAAAVRSVALDLDLDQNGTDDAMSFGFGVGTVPAWFTVR